jgi:hypothetical protein
MDMDESNSLIGCYFTEDRFSRTKTYLALRPGLVFKEIPIRAALYTLGGQG